MHEMTQTQTDNLLCSGSTFQNVNPWGTVMYHLVYGCGGMEGSNSSGQDQAPSTRAARPRGTGLQVGTLHKAHTGGKPGTAEQASTHKIGASASTARAECQGMEGSNSCGTRTSTITTGSPGPGEQVGPFAGCRPPEHKGSLHTDGWLDPTHSWCVACIPCTVSSACIIYFLGMRTKLPF